MGHTQKTYLPAAGHDRALPLYDPFAKVFGFDAARKILLDQADLRRSARILDVGCGTGTLAVLIKRLYPDVDVVGLDPDPKALARASEKARRTEASIRFDRGFSQNLPYADASFDRVFSAFMFHHLSAKDRPTMLREVRRVLKPGGSLHLVDFGGQHAPGRLLRVFHPSGRMNDNSDARILVLLKEAGFAAPKRVSSRAVLLGLLRITYFEAVA